MTAQAEAAQHGAHVLQLEARRRVAGQQVLHGRGLHVEGVHKVLRVPPNAQLVALAELAARGLQVAYTCKKNCFPHST